MIPRSEFEATTVAGTPNGLFHSRALPKFLPAAFDAFRVHLSAAHIMSAVGHNTNRQDELVGLLTCHSANLFWDSTYLVMQGKFDSASYLFRAAYDCAGLIRLAAADPSATEAFLKGEEVKGSRGRILAVADLRNLIVDGEDGLADDMNRVYSEDAAALNELAHVSVSHINKLIETMPNGKIRATIGGRMDAQEAKTLLRAVALSEIHTLSALRIVASSRLGEGWDSACVSAVEELATWIGFD